MRPDVLSLYRFYQSSIGRSVAQILSAKLVGLWSDAPPGPTVGLGYALPYLEAAENPVALMPSAQGVLHWPDMEQSLAALVNEYHLPLADSSVRRLLLVHALEHADRPVHFFREIWRVLAPGGQVIVVAPNRRRTWSASDTTPFGYGRPYSRRQLAELMQGQMLPPEQWDSALMMPPFRLPGAGRLMLVLERSIHSLGKNLGGVLVVSARKQVYGTLPGSPVKARRHPVLVPSSTALPQNVPQTSFDDHKI